jgi:hypothetical protein
MEGVSKGEMCKEWEVGNGERRGDDQMEGSGRMLLPALLRAWLSLTAGGSRRTIGALTLRLHQSLPPRQERAQVTLLGCSMLAMFLFVLLLVEFQHLHF